MLMFNTTKKVFFITFLVISLLVAIVIIVKNNSNVLHMFMGNKTNDSYSELSQLQKAEYIVAFSKQFKDETKFVLYNEKGQIIQQAHSDKFSRLQYYGLANDSYVFTSANKNKHAYIAPEGRIKDFSINPQKYTPERNYGTSAFNSSNSLLVYSLNIGTSEKGYVCEIAYQKNIGSAQTNIELTGGCIDSVATNENTIYAHYFNLQDKPGGIYLIDIETGKLRKKVDINNFSLCDTQNGRMKIWNNKLILASYNSDVTKSDKALPYLGEFDLKTEKITREIPLDERFIPKYMEINDEKIFLIDQNGKIRTYDTNYKMIKEYALLDDPFETKYKDKEAYISDVQLIENNELQVVFGFIPDPKEYACPAVVHVYDINTGALLRTTHLNLPDEKDWWGEIIAVIKVKK